MNNVATSSKSHIPEPVAIISGSRFRDDVLESCGEGRYRAIAVRFNTAQPSIVILGRRPEDPENAQNTNKFNILHDTHWILGTVAEDDDDEGIGSEVLSRGCSSAASMGLTTGLRRRARMLAARCALAVWRVEEFP